LVRIKNSYRIAGTPLAFSGNALLDEPTAQIGVDQTTISSCNSLSQTRIRDVLMPRETRKPPVLGDPRGAFLPRCSTIKMWFMDL
jgi:hypothetical protein